MRNAGGYSDNVSELASGHVGKVVTIIHTDYESDDETKMETTAVLYSLQRHLDSEGNLSHLKIRLGGGDASARNGLLFVLDADDASNGEFLFSI